MNHPKTKVYFDGSHYIGIPHKKQPLETKKELQKKQKARYKSELKKFITHAKKKARKKK